MELFEDERGGNAHEFTVSEISGAVKRTIEGEFGHVRVRGEVGRVVLARTGHMYFDLKDDRAVLAAISWKGQVARMSVRPEEGMEVIATGRLTTFPGQSKYQIIVEDVVPAGAGALMAMLEKRRLALAAEGLFDEGRKRPLPFLPEVIGVITSPTGAVIRDILHRLRDRFPRKVIIWPVAVQGDKCAPEVTAAIRGFNALTPGGAVPRPDLIIVARGGGSIEDLWGFNEESVVRAAAESDIPLISAVGHETDTTLIDHAADRRAPTPTAAAEMAVPVRMDLLAWVEEQGARLRRGAVQQGDLRRQRLRDLARGLGRPEALLDPARQATDFWGGRIGPALGAAITRKSADFNKISGRVRAELLTGYIRHERHNLGKEADRLRPAADRRRSDARERLGRLSERLTPAMARIRREMERRNAENLAGLDQMTARLAKAMPTRIAALADRLAALERTRQTLGYTETLKRGFAVVRGQNGVVTSRDVAEAAREMEIEFHDGRIAVLAGGGVAAPKPRKTPSPGDDQGSLF